MTEKIHSKTAVTNSLRDKVILVAGASSGVGATIARMLTASGAKVALVARRADLLTSVAETCGDHTNQQRLPLGVNTRSDQILSRALLVACALPIAADLTNEADVTCAMETAVRHFARLDAVILNAGVGLVGGIEQFSLENWQRVFATNVTSAFLVARAAIPHLRAMRGMMIAIGSEFSYGVMPGLGAYAASKWALLALMRTLALELRGQGIRVSSILPGGILTDFGADTIEGKLQRQAQGEKFLQPSEVAEAVRFLLTQPESVWTEELRIGAR